VGKDPDLVTRTGYHILVPVNGTDASRRGAELAFASSSPRDSEITALHVANPDGHASKARRGERRRRKAERDLVEDIRALAARYGHQPIRTSIHTDTEAPPAILKEAKQSGCDLIVLGTRRRVGDHLTIGLTATAILEQWQGGLVIVVT
jgi:nucleotide-binding universal stress UspA family protein